VFEGSRLGILLGFVKDVILKHERQNIVEQLQALTNFDDRDKV
jgi:hypothetical protein